MKKVYIQIIDPLNGTCVNAYHEYPNEYNHAMEATLRQYNLPNTWKHSETTGDNGSELPGMPSYLLSHGLVDGTSKLVNITVIG